LERREAVTLSLGAENIVVTHLRDEPRMGLDGSRTKKQSAREEEGNNLYLEGGPIPGKKDGGRTISIAFCGG
jgi:hypothetical protein